MNIINIIIIYNAVKGPQSAKNTGEPHTKGPPTAGGAATEENAPRLDVRLCDPYNTTEIVSDDTRAGGCKTIIIIIIIVCCNSNPLPLAGFRGVLCG